MVNETRSLSESRIITDYTDFADKSKVFRVKIRVVRDSERIINDSYFNITIRWVAEKSPAMKCKK